MASPQPAVSFSCREIVGIDPQTANCEACQMEHAISEDSFEKWEKYFSSVGIESKKA